MYVPNHFRVGDRAELHRFMRAHAFAVLVTSDDGAPFATHLPLLVEDDGGLGCVRGHVARANPQWRAFGAGEALVIFSGPHAYVTPAWYDGAENVPTWNYAAVHAYGTPHIIAGDAAVHDILARLVEREETVRAEPWTMDELSEAYLSRMMGAIVAFEMPIARLEGKYKLSQNRTPEEIGRIGAELSQSPDVTARDLGALMRHEPPALGTTGA